jgi:hypothetical protein
MKQFRRKKASAIRVMKIITCAAILVVVAATTGSTASMSAMSPRQFDCGAAGPEEQQAAQTSAMIKVRWEAKSRALETLALADE